MLRYDSGDRMTGARMTSRRRFLQLGSLGAGTLVAGLPALADVERKCPPLPPAIARLKSMKDQAKPITGAERIARQEQARRLMTANHLDAILLADGTSLDYFTGISWWGSERLFAMVLPAQGAAFYVCPAFEEDRAREQIAKFGDAKHADVRVWQEDENPYERLARGLKDRGISAGTLGLEETVRFVFADEIGKAAPQVKLVSATPVTSGCRMIKSDHEIALMRLAAKVTLIAYEAVYKSLKPGMTQNQIEDLIAIAYSRLGFPGEADVQTGEATASPHGSNKPQVIREGAIIMIDDGCKVEGYNSDITRTFVLGKASDKMNKVFDIVHRAQSAALKTAKPGVECQAVDATARKVITDAGYGPDYKFFAHRVGHGIGMDMHEWSYLVRGNSLPMKANMTFSDEPGIYIQGEFGIRLEDDMHITENGAELFTPQSPSLENPFGT
jgi:Xaa-Pro aminopeptidase